jgi:hypothetical protein
MSAWSPRRSTRELTVLSDPLLDTLPDLPLRLPLEGLLGSGGVGPSSLGVVGGDLLVDNVDSLGEGVALLLLDLLDNVLNISGAQHATIGKDLLGRPRRTGGW